MQTSFYISIWGKKIAILGTTLNLGKNIIQGLRKPKQSGIKYKKWRSFFDI